MPQADIIFLYGESVPACTHQIDKQYAGYFTLQYMSGGKVDLWIGPRHHALQGRWFWSAYPGPRIRFRAAEGSTSWSHRYLAFQGSIVKRWEREKLFPVPPQHPPGGVDFGPRFDNLLQLARRTDRRGVLQATHLLEGILLELSHAPSLPTQSVPWIERAMEKIANWSKSGIPDYTALAESLNISESTMRRRFQEATGTSPHGYLLQCRGGEARRLLGETDLPVKTIADQLGYRDVHFFSRQFRQLTGVPPAAYRRSRQG